MQILQKTITFLFLCRKSPQMQWHSTAFVYQLTIAQGRNQHSMLVSLLRASDPEPRVSNSEFTVVQIPEERTACSISFPNVIRGYSSLLGVAQPKFLTRESSLPTSKQGHIWSIPCLESLTSFSIYWRRAPAFKSPLWLSLAHETVSLKLLHVKIECAELDMNTDQGLC